MEIPLPGPLDALLGSLEAGAVTCFYGGPGTGKTNVCLLVAATAAKVGKKVLYIDTENSFSPERFTQVADKALAERIEIVLPKTFEEQGKVIRALAKGGPDLIIVDSLAALYRMEIAEPRETHTKRENKMVILEANRELSKQLSVLSVLAREKKIPILVTSHVYKNWDTGEEEPVGGDALKYWVKVLVLLERTGRTSERRATLVKHRALPEHGSVKFELMREGIRPSGFRLF